MKFRFEAIPISSCIAKKWLLKSKRNEFLKHFTNFKDFPDHFTPEEWKEIEDLLAELKKQSTESPLNDNCMKRACQNLEKDYHKSLNLMHKLPKKVFYRYSVKFNPQLSPENIEKRIEHCTRVLEGEIDISKLITSDECSGNF